MTTTTWTAPAVERGPQPWTTDERELLDALLDWHRQTLLAKCAGLTGDQLAIRSVDPSSLSLLGLVRHLADAERYWFRQHFAGERVDDLYVTEDQPDGDFDNVDPARAEQEFKIFATEVAAAHDAVFRRSLDDIFPAPNGDGHLSLRWLYLHMIAEYARHDGHADLLRQRIDGATGL
jgi:hypothetical protein